MTDTPKFTVVDRRKFRAEDDSASTSENTQTTPAETAEPAAKAAPRLTLVEPPSATPAPHTTTSAAAADDEPQVSVAEELEDAELPPVPTAEESSFQKAAYDKSAERLDDLVRAQNPGAPAPEKIGFDHLVQQLYLSAMMQMGAGTPEGQRPRIDILGARQTIDLMGVLSEKTKGNLSAQEERTLQTVLYELRMTFLELTRMISTQQPVPPPPGGVKR
jgi:uncharacterized protein DUF1844